MTVRIVQICDQCGEEHNSYLKSGMGDESINKIVQISGWATVTNTLHLCVGCIKALRK